MPEGAVPEIPNPNPYITVVSGLPRSGTSLMMQMLAAGGIPILSDWLRPADPDNPRGYFEFQPVKRTRQDSSWLTQAQGRAVKVVYALLRDLPETCDYRVIFMRRPLTEVIASQRAMLTRLGREGARIPDPALVELFAKELAQTDEWLARQPNFRVLDIEYHACLNQPAKVAARVCGFLDSAPDRAAMLAAVDPALHRQR